MYTIGREERENHKGRFKACLYYDGQKIAVCKEGKVQLKTHRPVPDSAIEQLTEEWELIAAEEAVGTQ